MQCILNTFSFLLVIAHIFHTYLLWGKENRTIQSQMSCCHKEFLNLKQKQKELEVALWNPFLLMLPPYCIPLVYCFLFHTYLSSNLAAFGQGKARCRGSIPELEDVIQSRCSIDKPVDDGEWIGGAQRFTLALSSLKL